MTTVYGYRVCLVALTLGAVSTSRGVLGSTEAAATKIQWYRTAQATSDRLTPQAAIEFGPDFASDITIAINRCIKLDKE